MTQILLKSRLDADQTEFVETVWRSGEALLDIINDILDFSKIESGEQFSLESEPYNLHELLDGIKRLLQSRAETKGIRLVCHLETNVPRFVRGDDGRLRQVIVNLLGNGIKFTDSGTVALHVSLVAETPVGFRIRFEVTDSGIGMKPEDLQKLFLPFSQAESSGGKRRGGTGLGLAISKRLVEMMGGSIKVQSEFRKGSTFTFEIELPRLTPKELEARNQTAKEAASAKKLNDSAISPSLDNRNRTSPIATNSDQLSILVAEDHDINRKLISHMLHRLGFDCEFALNGKEAIEKWERLQPDLIFMDCQMPELDGFEATREIRRRESLKKSPIHAGVGVVALTANALKGDKERCLAAGMSSYMSKPFSLDQLREEITVSIKSRSETYATKKPTEVPATIAVLDESRTLQLFNELGPEVVESIVNDCLQDLPNRLNEMGGYIEQNRWEDLQRCAHSLTGVASSLGLNLLASECRKIESAAAAKDPEQISHPFAEIGEHIGESIEALQKWLNNFKSERGEI